MIAMKVRNERWDENDARNTANEAIFIPSPFLWYDMIAGDLLPLLGVILFFFVVNYPRVKEFWMAFYIDMMSIIWYITLPWTNKTRPGDDIVWLRIHTLFL